VYDAGSCMTKSLHMVCHPPAPPLLARFPVRRLCFA
jgi:hypothetical protein